MMLLTVNDTDKMVSILESIASNTKNDAIKTFIVMVIAAAIIVPIVAYVNIKRRKTYAEEQKVFMDVINRNTEAFTDLKVTLSENNITIQTILQSIENDAHSNNNKLNLVLESQKNLSSSISDIENGVESVSIELAKQGVKIGEIVEFEKQKTKKAASHKKENDE